MPFVYALYTAYTACPAGVRAGHSLPHTAAGCSLTIECVLLLCMPYIRHIWQVFVRGIPFRARPLDLVDLFEAYAGTVTRIEGMYVCICVCVCARVCV